MVSKRYHFHVKTGIFLVSLRYYKSLRYLKRTLPEVDSVEIPIPMLHFGKKQRGRLPANVKVFDGEFGDLEAFVPKQLPNNINE